MTLIDSRRDIALALMRSLESVLGVVVPETAVVALIGQPLTDMVRTLVPTARDDRVAACVARYKEDFFDNCAVHTRVFPGVRETLDQLRKQQVRLAVATTKMTFMARRVCESLRLAELLDHVQGTDDFPHKPDPEVVLRACRALDVAPAAAVLVGDTVMDVRAARQCGAQAVAVTYGVARRDDLAAAGPSALIDRFDELLRFFPEA